MAGYPFRGSRSSRGVPQLWAASVIPGRERNGRTRNLEILGCAIAHLRSGPSDHPGMTVSEPSKHLEIFALFPFRYFGLEALDFGVLDMDVIVDKPRTQRVAKERIVF